MNVSEQQIEIQRQIAMVEFSKISFARFYQNLITKVQNNPFDAVLKYKLEMIKLPDKKKQRVECCKQRS